MLMNGLLKSKNFEEIVVNKIGDTNEECVIEVITNDKRFILVEDKTKSTKKKEHKYTKLFKGRHTQSVFLI